MKHLIKTSLWLLTFMTAGGLLVSCVEEEQEPDFGETGGSTSAKIDVKMPAPGYYGGFYPGSEVLLKGSGFSGRDEVYVQRATYQYDDNDYEEYVADGPKVRAEVTRFTSAELTFLVPVEVVQNYSSVLVFFKRDGKEYRLGHMDVQPFPVHLDMPDMVAGSIITMRSDNLDFAFVDGDKIFLQNCVEHNGNREGVGEKIQAVVESMETSELCFIVPQQITGQVLVILEHKGIEFTLEGYFEVRSLSSVVSLSTFGAYIGEEIHLMTNAGNFFTSTDEVYLRPVKGGEKVKAQITYRNDWQLSFRVPDLFNGAYGEAVVILKHYREEYQLDGILQIYGNY